jgi:hypothetical protein
MANQDIYEDISYLENDLELAEYIQNIVIGRATGGDFDNTNYKVIRSKFLSNKSLKDFIPDYIKKCRDVEQFWQFIKAKYSGDGCYTKRKNYIYETFQDLLDYLETENIQGKKTTHLYYKDEIKTIDDELDKLIQEAKDRFEKTSDKEVALVMLWGAFERIKTFYDTNKRLSAEELINKISTDFDKDFIKDEFDKLTKIGNNYRIRHHEKDKIEITDIKHIDYLFLRMLALLNLCLENIKIQDKSERTF